jgi:hypothetical protein
MLAVEEDAAITLVEMLELVAEAWAEEIAQHEIVVQELLTVAVVEVGHEIIHQADLVAMEALALLF